MTVGIYKLSFTGTEMVYIGQSTNIQTRYNTHMSLLRSNKSSKKLQNAYNTYGVPSLEILLECAVEELDSAEEQAMEIFDSIENGFNTMSEAGHRSQLCGELAGNAKYSNELIEEVFHYLVDNILTHKEICDITGISRGAIADISYGGSHRWLELKHPNKYKQMLSLKGTARKSNKNTAHTKGIIYPSVISPEGTIYTPSSLRGFCREHGLNHGSFGEMLRGFRKGYKGWKVYHSDGVSI